MLQKEFASNRKWYNAGTRLSLREPRSRPDRETSRTLRPVTKRTPDRRQPVRWNPASPLCAQASQPIAYTLAWRANVERGAAWFLDIHRGEKTGHAKANREVAPSTGETTVRTDANRTTPLRARRATDGPLSRIPIVLPATGPWEGSVWQERDPRPAFWTRKRRPRKPCPACATPRSGERKRLGLHRFNRNRLESGQPAVRLRASTRIPNFSNLIHPEAEPVWNGGRPDACGRRGPEPLPRSLAQEKRSRLDFFLPE